MANAIILPPLPIAAAVASSTGVGAPGNVANDFAGVIWASANVASTTLTIDLGDDHMVDTLMLFGLFAPAGAQITVYAATSEQGPGFTPGTYYGSPAQPLFAGINRLTSGAGVSYWRAPADGRPAVRHIRIGFFLAAPGIIQIGRVAVGQQIALHRNFSFGASFGARDLGSLDYSARGVMLRRRGAKLRTASLTFSSIHPTEMGTAILPLLEWGGNTEPFALLTNPAPDAMIEQRFYFGTLVGDLGGVWRNAVGYEWKANLISRF